MLCPGERKIERGFVKEREIGCVILHPDIRYCRISYASADYNDSLYKSYKIDFPNHFVRAPRKRKAEYLAGRICSQIALAQFGIKASAISRHPERDPKWPPGFNGSISHTVDEAIAVVIPEGQGWVGVDVEEVDACNQLDISEEIISNEERRVLSSNSQLKENVAMMIGFSAKESLFKALYPQLKTYFGFDHAAVVSINENNLTLNLTHTLSPTYTKGTTVDCHFLASNELVLTLVFIREFSENKASN